MFWASGGFVIRRKSAFRGSRGASSGAAIAMKTMRAPTNPPAAARVLRRLKRTSARKIEERPGCWGMSGDRDGPGFIPGPANVGGVGATSGDRDGPGFIPGPANVGGVGAISGDRDGPRFIPGPGSGGGGGAMSGPPLKTNPGVEPRVAQIDQHVDDDEDRRIEQHEVLNDDDVALDHGGDERAPESRHAERLLDRDGATQHEPQQHARDGDDRQERIRQSVAEHDEALAQSLGARRPDEVVTD